jgi:hypothetical protein
LEAAVRFAEKGMPEKYQYPEYKGAELLRAILARRF